MSDLVLARRKLLARGGAVAAGAAVVGVASASPASAAAASFNAITPYRSFDSRGWGPERLAAQELYDVDLITDQAGNSRVPATATAVTYNLTVTGTSGVGYLSIWPADSDFPGISTINWTTPNLDLANGGTVRVAVSTFTGLSGSVTIGCDGSPGTATHFIVDVTGYYA